MYVRGIAASEMWVQLRPMRSTPLSQTLNVFRSKRPLSASTNQWIGLQQWREAPLNHDRTWGPKGPEPPLTPATSPLNQHCNGFQRTPSSLSEWGTLVLSTSDPITKARLSHHAYTLWRENDLCLGVWEPPDRPARPPKPHLEALGTGFFSDFAHVADDESRHYLWCSERLAELGFSYGDMPAHNLLWRECEKTSGCVAARLAVIPLVQEARGLDAGPRLVKKLVGFGDNRTSSIVAKIAEEEVQHVSVGVFWFVSVCAKMGCTPDVIFKDLLKEYNVELKGPFNHAARDEAGIPRDWYDESYTTKDRNGLSEVHERLACIISMEKQNSALGDYVH
ncbi:uncharacterized protein LOC18442199 isoform X2 [Amborella trichopoda]|uniref:uncharacterized protein LOC18442199 isoform X2 n=1 Tax=Amborella trichopoda TaxID=13333 RepID=UPI0009BCE3DE|nr:uncharacterized protein LOC18442199 isoform X2 [Amborella trichopoda]|eukprot:XP_020527917.1 uncharacterized protein LOC18442199 isoform X2 [Amborella trichopoda]